jgi:formylglycine-generating enzyme required for sulfatase activity
MDNIAAAGAGRQPNLLIRPTGIPAIDEMPMCWVPEGEFWMGSDDADPFARSNEKPIHKVWLSTYAIGRFQVTNAQFQAFVDASGYVSEFETRAVPYTWRTPHGPGTTLNGKDTHPVWRLNWDDVSAFCNWLSQRTGAAVTLPTEAQWEKAARGGLLIPPAPITQPLVALSEPTSFDLIPNPEPRRVYPWSGTHIDATLCNVNCVVNETTPVGHYSPQGDSVYGCADLIGNVDEWCADRYNPDEYRERAGSPLVRNPAGPGGHPYYRLALRGLGYWYDAEHARCAFRDGDIPGASDPHGFRVVLSPTQR